MDRTRNLGASLALAATLVLPLAGCSDDDPIAPGGAGTVEVVVHDAAPPSGSPSFDPPTSADLTSVSGEFRADARVEVFVDGDWQDLSGFTSLDVRADLQEGESSVASASVEARTYERVRIVLQNARSELDGSTIIDLGPIGVSVNVIVGGGGELVVERNQPLQVQADGTTRLVLELNSAAWLDSEAVANEAVARTDFEGAADIAVQ